MDEQAESNTTKEVDMELGKYDETTNEIILNVEECYEDIRNNVGYIVDYAFKKMFGSTMKQYNSDLFCSCYKNENCHYIYFYLSNKEYSAFNNFRICIDSSLRLDFLKNEIQKITKTFEHKKHKAMCSVFESELNNLYMQGKLFEYFDITEMEMRRAKNSYFTYIKINKYDSTYRFTINKKKEVSVVINFRNVKKDDIVILCESYSIRDVGIKLEVSINKKNIDELIEIIKSIVAYLENSNA